MSALKTILPAVLALAWSTASAQVWPFKLVPAGLYRIDMVADITKLRMPARIEHHSDGPTGDEINLKDAVNKLFK